MIRRWSHINIFSSTARSTFRVIEAKTSFSLFKTNVKFKNIKKLKIKFSKLKRKAFKRLKHQSNLMQNVRVFKFWALDYRLTRNIARFDYFYYIFLNNTLVYNYSYVARNNEQLSHNAPFLLSNCNKTMLLVLSRMRGSFISRKALAPQNFVSTFAWAPTAFLEFDHVNYVPTYAKYDNSLLPINFTLTPEASNDETVFNEFFFLLEALLLARTALLRQFAHLSLLAITI